MKKLLLLLFALAAMLNVQTLSAQSGYVVNLPGGAAGASSNISVPALNTLITDYPFTLEMWVNPGAITAYDGFFYDKSATKTCLQFANATTGELRFDLFGGANAVPLTAAKKLTVGKWQHLAVTVYKDSAVVEIDGSFYAAAHTRVFASFCTVAPTIGWDKDAADRALGGYMDDVRIWKSARSRAEISTSKSTVLAGTETDLVAYYNFDNNTTNDKTTNALNATATGTTLVDLATVSTLSGITVSGGTLVPAFSPAVTSYTVYAPADVPSVVVTGVATAPVASVTNNPATINSTTTSVVMACTSGDGLSTTNYTITYSQLTIADWNAKLFTGTQTYPNMWGWANTSTAIPWQYANGSGGCRYRDYNATGGHTGFTNESDGSISTTRQFMLRFDNAAYSGSYYSFPVKLEACKTYNFDWDYVLGGSGTPPNTITVGIDTTKNGTGRLSSKVFTTTSSATIYRHGTYTFSTGNRSGVFYITINSGAAAWYGITNLAIAENVTETLVAGPAPLYFTEEKNVKTILVTGNALTNDITLAAPAGITLDKTSIAKADAQCGVSVTATFDKVASKLDTIVVTSGSLVQKIGFVTSVDSKCYTPLYADRTNLVANPYVDDIAAFGGWGAKSIYYNPDSAYCGGSSALISGGSIDATLTGKIKANTRYRVKAMVKAATTNAQLGVFGWSTGQPDILNKVAVTRVWTPIDFVFKTGTTIAATHGAFFNNSPGSYIDNWEIYAMPTLSAVKAPVANMVTTIGNPFRDTITVFGTEMAANVTIAISGAKASLFSINKTTIAQVNGKADSTKIAIAYSPIANSAGDTVTLTISSTDAESLVYTLVGSTVALETSVASLGFTEANAQKTFTVTGVGLASDITLTAPTGISLDVTTIAKADALAGVTVTATFDKAATGRDTIRISSGSLLRKVVVITSADSKCFTPLYTGRTNLVGDSYLNDLATFGGWGAKSIYINPDTAYCGSSAGLISGGSIDVVLTGKMKTNTRYRVKAMVKAASTNARIGVFGWSSGQGDINNNATVVRAWAPIDFTFQTGTALNATQGIFFNNASGSYVDNWEMYAMPTIGAVQTTIPKMGAMVGKTDKDSIIAFGTELSADVTITLSGNKASLFSVSKSTIAQTNGKADSTKIVITYSPIIVSLGDTATLTITSTDADSKVFTLVGSADLTSVKPIELSDMSVINRNGTFTVKFNNKPGTVTVYDLNGKVVMKQMATSLEQSFTIDNTGIYIVKLNSEGKTKSVKVVKTN